MAEFIEVDVRGLSCPEPVLLVMDAMDEHPGETIRVQQYSHPVSYVQYVQSVKTTTGSAHAVCMCRSFLLS